MGTKSNVVRYTTHPQHAEANAAMVASVFAALTRARPGGLRYEVLRSLDGLTFTHVATVDEGLPAHPLTSLPEFQAFVADIGERCEIPPQQLPSATLGSYPA